MSSGARTLTHRALNWAPVAWFGRMSYGFYLVHQIVISALQEHLSGKVLVLVLSLALSTLVTWVLHLAVERPMGRLRSKVLRRLNAAPGAAAVAPAS